jgi:hypothetical protein
MPDSAKNGNRHGNDNKISIYAGFAGEISKQGQHLFKTSFPFDILSLSFTPFGNRL